MRFRYFEAAQFQKTLQDIAIQSVPLPPMRGLESIVDLAPRLKRKEVSPVELTRACLERIEKLNPVLNTFITVTAESALAEARTAEAEILRGEWRGPLHGIPIALKDLIDTAGIRTTAASALFERRIPTEDAEVVRRLKQAGAVILGKNNLHEFAYGGSSLVSSFGDIYNPRNTAHIAGGSSGGSAAAVAAGLCYAAIGTDTAGSIREPAALCGCVGIKPTYGRVSARGVIPLSWSLDHALGRSWAATVADAEAVLQAIAGYDALDIGSTDVPVADYVSCLSEGTLKSFALAFRERTHFYDELNEEVRAAVMEQALGVRFGRWWRWFVTCGSKCPTTEPCKRPNLLLITPRMLLGRRSCTSRRRCGGFGRVRGFRRRTTFSGGGSWIRNGGALVALLTVEVDLLVTPTMPIPAPTIADLRKDPAALRPAELALLRNTRPFNVWGLPAISVPCGLTKNGLPIGLQVAGAPWREDLVLRLAHRYERAVNFSAK